MPADARFLFAQFELDPTRRRLTSAGEPVAISDHQFDVLLLLVAKAGQIVGKDDLLQAGWKDVAVGDNSIEQAISSLRRLLGTQPSGAAYIETVPRRGYRFGVAVTRTAARESDAGLDALLAPHRSFIEGRAALETLDQAEVGRARAVFEEALQMAPEHPSAHIGLANAGVMQFEMTRERPPDVQWHSSPTTGGTTFACRALAGARNACGLHTALWPCCRPFRWPIGLPPRCTWRARCWARPNGSWRRAFLCRAASPPAARSSTRLPCTGFWG